MKESKFELKNWKRWKHTLVLLEKSKQEISSLTNITHSDDKSSIALKHQVIQKRKKQLIDELEVYEMLIHDYKFFISRLENAINELLNEDEHVVVMIYANDPDNALAREYNALEQGISRTTYYKLLNSACNKLDKVLDPLANLKLENYIYISNHDL